MPTNTPQYVLSLETEGYKLLTVIKHVLPYLRNQFSDQEQYNQLVARVYHELTTQCIAAMPDDDSEFSFNLLSLPDFTPFIDILDLTDNANQAMLANAFRMFSMWLFFEIREKCNYHKQRCSYLLEAVTPSYIIVWKTIEA